MTSVINREPLESVSDFTFFYVPRLQVLAPILAYPTRFCCIYFDFSETIVNYYLKPKNEGKLRIIRRRLTGRMSNDKYE